MLLKFDENHRVDAYASTPPKPIERIGSCLAGGGNRTRAAADGANAPGGNGLAWHHADQARGLLDIVDRLADAEPSPEMKSAIADLRGEPPAQA